MKHVEKCISRNSNAPGGNVVYHCFSRILLLYLFGHRYNVNHRIACPPEIAC